MMTENSKNEISQKIQEILEKMGFVGQVAISETVVDGRETVEANIRTEESNFLIGQYGVNLQALQHLTRVILRKVIEEKVNFILDVNSYRKEKNSTLEKMARELAEQAIREQRAVVMRPMTPYERRIVHLELAKNVEVVTESIGEGEDRKVIIKPAQSL